jgi:hypothetical protein
MMQNKSVTISIELCPIEFLFPLLIDVRGSEGIPKTGRTTRDHPRPFIGH